MKLADFGLVKQLKPGNLTSSYCGSAVYLPPEVAQHKAYGKGVDWYLLGELLYETLIGRPPFYSKLKYEIREFILYEEPWFPDFMNPVLKEFLQSLLCKNPSRRLGFKFGAAEIKAHPFFTGIDWNRVLNKGFTLFDPETVKPQPLKSQGLPILNLQQSEDTFNVPYWSFSQPNHD